MWLKWNFSVSSPCTMLYIEGKVVEGASSSVALRISVFVWKNKQFYFNPIFYVISRFFHHRFCVDNPWKRQCRTTTLSHCTIVHCHTIDSVVSAKRVYGIASHLVCKDESRVCNSKKYLRKSWCGERTIPIKYTHTHTSTIQKHKLFSFSLNAIWTFNVRKGSRVMWATKALIALHNSFCFSLPMILCGVLTFCFSPLHCSSFFPIVGCTFSMRFICSSKRNCLQLKQFVTQKQQKKKQEPVK